MRPGPKPKPTLQLVREGNPGHQKLSDPVVVPPAELVEPNWLDWWPATRDKELQPVNARAREVARREWRRVVPVLEKSVGLGGLDANLVVEYCICVARIDECEREISRRGVLIRADRADRGLVRNPATTVVAQYRTQLARYIGELGLSPSARTRLTPAKGANGEGEDPFGAVG